MMSNSELALSNASHNTKKIQNIELRLERIEIAIQCLAAGIPSAALKALKGFEE